MPFHKRMAIIGGLGPHAGAYALQVLLEQAAADYGAHEDHEYPDVILHSIPFRGSDKTGIADGVGVLRQEQESLQQLEGSGVELVLLACNSSHAYLDELRGGTQIEIISLIDAAQHEVAVGPAQQVGVLASQSTRGAGLYEKALSDQSLALVDGGVDFQTQVNALIAEAMRPKISAGCIKMYQTVVETLAARGAEAVILGCTEISRLKSLAPLPILAIDSLEAGTRAMLKKSWQPNP